MMTSRILASLENKEYITREKMQDNARSKLVILTEKGKEALTIALRQVSEMEANFFKPSDRSFIDSMDDILSDCAIQAASSSIE